MDIQKFKETLGPLVKYLKITLDSDQVEVYYKRLQHVPSGILAKAVDILIDETEVRNFPLLPVFSDAIDEAKKIVQGESPRSETDEPTDFCQACENRGFVIIGYSAHPCTCRRGRIKQAVLTVPDGVGPKARQEIIKKALKRLAPASPPIQGLMEWNPAGFWEATQAEHDKWMAGKRAEIAEIDARRGAKAKKMDSGEAVFAEIVKNVVTTFGPGREPGEDEESREEEF